MKMLKMLVVDDKKENIAAAKIAFSKLGFDIVFAFSAKEAMETIQTSFETNGTFFDLVLSDMEMEEKNSGMKVVAKGFEYLAFTFIVTGQEKGGHNHGPSTRIEPGWDKKVSGQKNRPEVWVNIFEEIKKQCEGEFKETIEALVRYKKFVGQPSRAIAEILMSLYNLDL